MRFTETKNRTNSRKSFQASVQSRKRLLNTARPFRKQMVHHHTFPMMKREKALYLDIQARDSRTARFGDRPVRIVPGPTVFRPWIPDTGFIPHARSLYAKGYPDQTRDALVSTTPSTRPEWRI